MTVELMETIQADCLVFQKVLELVDWMVFGSVELMVAQ